MSFDSESRGLLTFLIIICHYPYTVTSQAAECPSPASIANGRLRSSGPYFNQSEAVYDCDAGYAIVGSAGAICWPTGSPQWESISGGAFPPRCEPPPPEDNRQTENNYYNGMPEWLQILLGVLLGLLLLLLLLLLILGLWYLCCRACCCCCASSGENTSSSSTSKQEYSEAITTTNTTTTTGTGTGGGKVSTQDVGTQVRMQEPGSYPSTVTYSPNYQQKPPNGTTVTKVQYVEETHKSGGSNNDGSNNTSSNKTSTNNTSTTNTSTKTTNATSTNQVTPWMPHSQPTRNDVYHIKSSTK